MDLNGATSSEMRRISATPKLKCPQPQRYLQGLIDVSQPPQWQVWESEPWVIETPPIKRTSTALLRSPASDPAQPGDSEMLNFQRLQQRVSLTTPPSEADEPSFAGNVWPASLQPTPRAPCVSPLESSEFLPSGFESRRPGMSPLSLESASTFQPIDGLAEGNLEPEVPLPHKLSESYVQSPDTIPSMPRVTTIAHFPWLPQKLPYERYLPRLVKEPHLFSAICLPSRLPNLGNAESSPKFSRILSTPPPETSIGGNTDKPALPVALQLTPLRRPRFTITGRDKHLLQKLHVSMSPTRVVYVAADDGEGRSSSMYLEIPENGPRFRLLDTRPAHWLAGTTAKAADASGPTLVDGEIMWQPTETGLDIFEDVFFWGPGLNTLERRFDTFPDKEEGGRFMPIDGFGFLE